MSAPANEFDVNCDPSTLSNAALLRNVEQSTSFRNPMPSTSSTDVPLQPPVLPPLPDLNPQSYNPMGNGYGYGGMPTMPGSYGMGYGGGYGFGGMGAGYGMGSMGMGAMGAMPYGGYNRFNHGDIESRFIQMAEENSRPAFDSIQSVVSAVGSVAMMLDNTFIALTSSFRAILGVAENFGRLRSLFAQIWSTFAVIRSINWLVRKLMVLLGIRTENEFRAWAEAVAATTQPAPIDQHRRNATWPILLFFGVIMAAPYIVLRMFNGLSSNINENLMDPRTWQNPLKAIAQHRFRAVGDQQLNMAPNAVVTVAPQHLQGSLWNSGWVMATVDGRETGLVPVNHLKFIHSFKNTDTLQRANQSHQNKSAAESKRIMDLDKYYIEDL